MDVDFPRTLVRLYADGRADYWGGRSRAGLSEGEVERRIEDSATDVFWWTTVEFEESLEALRAWTPVDYMRPGLQAIAGEGNGDLYCLFPAWRDGSRVPVIYWFHDQDESVLYARDVDEFLVRAFLEHNANAWAFENDERLKQDRLRALRSHREHLLRLVRPELHATLRRLGGTPSVALCREVLEKLVATIPSRRLQGMRPLQP